MTEISSGSNLPGMVKVFRGIFGNFVALPDDFSPIVSVLKAKKKE